MSNSNPPDGLHELDTEKVLLMEDAPVAQSGYGLIFSEATAQEISEFVHGDLFKKLKRNYALQKKDRIARQALNSAHNTEWLHYFKGMAAAVDLFFKDMESIAKELKKDDDNDNDTDEKDDQ